MTPKYEQGISRISTPVTGLRSVHYLASRELFRDVAASSVFATGRLLDIGCGNKPYQSIFAKRVSNYIGIDVDPNGARGDIVGNCLHLPFRDECFDVVLATQVIEHVPEPHKMIAEAARVLKQGGHLIVTAPQAWRLHEVPYDYFRFTKYGLSYLIEINGLVPVVLKPQGGAWALVGQVVCNTVCNKMMFRRLVPLVNLVFGFMDRVWCDEGDTLNYMVVATK